MTVFLAAQQATATHPLITVTFLFAVSLVACLGLELRFRWVSAWWAQIDLIWVGVSALSLALLALASFHEPRIQTAEARLSALRRMNLEITAEYSTFYSELCETQEGEIYFDPDIHPKPYCKKADNLLRRSNQVSNYFGPVLDATKKLPVYTGVLTVTSNSTPAGHRWFALDSKRMDFDSLAGDYNHANQPLIRDHRNYLNAKLAWLWIFPLLVGLRFARALVEVLGWRRALASSTEKPFAATETPAPTKA